MSRKHPRKLCYHCGGQGIARRCKKCGGTGASRCTPATCTNPGCVAQYNPKKVGCGHKRVKVSGEDFREWMRTEGWVRGVYYKSLGDFLGGVGSKP